MSGPVNRIVEMMSLGLVFGLAMAVGACTYESHDYENGTAPAHSDDHDHDHDDLEVEIED